MDQYIGKLLDNRYEILERIGDNLYLAAYNGVRCTAIFNIFVGRYFVDDVYGVQRAKQWGK